VAGTAVSAQSALFGGGFAGFLSHKHEGLGSYRQPAVRN